MTELEKEIKKVEDEVAEAKKALLEKVSFLAGLQRASKLQEKAASRREINTLRPGTAMHRSMEIIRANQQPMHINEILKAMGKEVTKKTRVSLAGSLNSYSKKGQIFTRPNPNTFGLIDLDEVNADGEAIDFLGTETDENFAAEDELPL